MKLRALADLPNHISAGDEFEENAVIGGMLIHAGIALEVCDPPEVQPMKPKRPYRRRSQAQ